VTGYTAALPAVPVCPL